MADKQPNVKVLDHNWAGFQKNTGPKIILPTGKEATVKDDDNFLSWTPPSPYIKTVPQTQELHPGVPLPPTKTQRTEGVYDLGPTVIPKGTPAEDRLAHRLPVPMKGVSPAPGAIQAPPPMRVGQIGYDPDAMMKLGEAKFAWMPIPEYELPRKGKHEGSLPYGLAPNLGAIDPTGTLSKDQLAIQEKWEENQETQRISDIQRKFQGYTPGQMHPARAWLFGDKPGEMAEHASDLITRQAHLGIRALTGSARFMTMWLDILGRYGAGTIEKALSYSATKGFPDYDETAAAKNYWAIASDQLSELINWQEENLDIKNRNVSEQTAIRTIEYFTSMTGIREVRGVIGVVRQGAQTISDTVKRTSDYHKMLRNLPQHQPSSVAETIKLEAKVAKVLEPMEKKAAIKRAGIEKSPLSQLSAAEATIKGFYDIAMISPAARSLAKLEQEINAIKENVTKNAFKQFPKLGKQFPIPRKNKDTGEWEINMTPVEKASVLGTVHTGKHDPITGLPIYKDVQYLKTSKPYTFYHTSPYDPIQTKIRENTIRAYAASGAATATAIWEDIFKGTKWESYKHLAGLGGIFINPPAAFKISEMVLVNFIPGVAGRIGLKLKSTIPGTDIKREISIPHGILVAKMALDKLRGLEPTDYVKMVRNDKWIEKDGKDIVVSEWTPIREFPASSIFNSNFGQKVAGWSAGLPPSKLWTDNTVVLRDADGDLINPRRVYNPSTGKYVWTGDTAFDVAMTLRANQLDIFSGLANRMASTMTPETRLMYEQVLKQHNQLEKDLRAIGHSEFHDTFIATLDQVHKAISHQAMASEFSKVLATERGRQTWFGKLGLVFDAEMQLAYNMIRQKTLDADASILFVTEKMKQLAGSDPILQKQFEGMTGNISKLVARMRGKQDELNLLIKELDSTTETALSMESAAFLDKLIHASKETGGSGIGAKFGLESSTGEVNVVALEKHGDDFIKLLKDGQSNWQKYTKKAYEFKNDPESTAYKLFELDIPVGEFLQTFKGIRGKFLGDDVKIENMLAKFAEFNMKNPGENTFFENLTAYARYEQVSNTELYKDWQSLYNLALHIHQKKIPVYLNARNFRFRGVPYRIETSEPELGGVDILHTLGRLEEYSKNFHPDPDISKHLYLKRFLANLRGDTSIKPNAEERLSETLQGHLTFHDMVSLRSNLGQAIDNNRFNEMGPKLIPSVKEVEAIIQRQNIPFSKEAAEAWTAYSETYASPLGRKVMREFGVGKHNAIEKWELPETIINMPSSESVPFLTRAFSDIPSETGTILQKNNRDSMKDLLDDSVHMMLIHPDKQKKVTGRIQVLEQLERAGFLSSSTVQNVKDFKRRIVDPAQSVEIFKNMEEKGNRLTDLLNVTTKAIGEVTEESNLGELRKVKTLDEAFEYLTASKITVTERPILQVERIGKTIKSLETSTQRATDIIEKVKEKPWMKKDELDKLITDIKPKQIYDIQGSRVEVFLETVFGIKPGATSISAIQRKQLGDFRQLMFSKAFNDSVSPTTTRRNAFLPEVSTSKDTFAHTFFGLSTDIDLKKFTQVVQQLDPLLSRVNKLLGDGDEIEKGLDAITKAVILLKSDSPDVQAAQELLKRIPRALTYPAALSRVYAGLRGVVSWRYLASEQMIREHQRAKATMLHALMTDTRLQMQLASIIEGRRLSKVDQKELRKKVSKIMGGRMVVYSEDEIGMSSPLYDEEISDDLWISNLANMIHRHSSLLRTRDISGGVPYVKEEEVIDDDDDDFLSFTQPPGSIEETSPQEIQEHLSGYTEDFSPGFFKDTVEPSEPWKRPKLFELGPTGGRKSIFEKND